MMMVDHRQNYLESIRAIFSTFVYPVQLVVDAPTSAGLWVGDVLSSRETLLQENTRLKKEQTLLQVQVQKLSSLIVENNRLRDLLQSSRKVGQNVLVGELLAVDLEPFTRQIVINKGSNDAVFIGQPILDADGVMGQIIHVGPFSSTAMMITDPNHAIPVHVNRNGQRAILFGTGKPDVLEVPFLANSADIVEGDLLISSGLGGRFPPDYPVAVVVKVEKDPAKPYAVITATPTAKLERSREVLLVWQTQEGAPKASAPLQINPEILFQAEQEVARQRMEQQADEQVSQQSGSDTEARNKVPSSATPKRANTVPSQKERNKKKPNLVPRVTRSRASKPASTSAVTAPRKEKISTTNTRESKPTPIPTPDRAATPAPTAVNSDSPKSAVTGMGRSGAMPIQEEFLAPLGISGGISDTPPTGTETSTVDEGR